MFVVDNVRGWKHSWLEMFVAGNVRGCKCPWLEIVSGFLGAHRFRRNPPTGNVRAWKCSWLKMFVTENSSWFSRAHRLRGNPPTGNIRAWKYSWLGIFVTGMSVTGNVHGWKSLRGFLISSNFVIPSHEYFPIQGIWRYPSVPNRIVYFGTCSRNIQALPRRFRDVLGDVVTGPGKPTAL